MSSETQPDYEKIRLAFIFLGTLSFGLGLYGFQASEVTDDIEKKFYILCGSGVLTAFAFYLIPILISNSRGKMLMTILDILYSIGFGATLLAISSMYIIKIKELENVTCQTAPVLISCQEYTAKIIGGAVAIINGSFHICLALGLIAVLKLAISDKDSGEDS